MLPLLAAAALAAPQLAVVGLHLADTSATQAADDSKRLVDILEDAGKLDILSPEQVGRRIAGRENLILEEFALGPGRERLAEARVLYDRAQLDQVGSVLDDAAARLASGLAYATSTRDLQDALVLRGMADFGMGDEEAAKAAFAKVVALDPARELDPVNYPPRVVELYSASRADVRKRAAAHLRVTSSVAATAWLDGREIGPTPVEGYAVVPGRHYLLVRAKDGASAYAALDVGAGEDVVRDELLARRGVGESAGDNPGRSRQTRELYRAVGKYLDQTLVVLAGVVDAEKVGLQLYAPATGTFSKVLTAEAGDDPLGALADLAPSLVGFVAENGGIKPEKVSPQVAPLDISQNDVLAGLLYEPKGAETVVVREQARRGVPWWVWAGAGALAAGGGVTAAVLLLDQPEEQDPNQGTITVGPFP